ncbi:MAG: helix-turn-helix transcriptional regulator [Eggerthellaceae bacterium]|nr:helix-turn-helix transcriptional regulator [Eggerthellaceae bacterium]
MPTIPSAKQTLATNLKRLRSSARISQEELADRAGLHRTYISSVERGERNITLENIFHSAAGLGVDPRELLKPLKDEVA